MLGRSEQPRPDLPRNSPPVRVNRPQFLRPLRAASGPPASGHSSASSAPTSSAIAARLCGYGTRPFSHRRTVFGIDTQAGGDVIFAQPRPQQGPAQWLVHRRHLPEREDTPDRTRRRP